MTVNLNADVGKILKDLLDRKASKSGGSVGYTPVAKNNMLLYKNTILYAVLITCVFLSLVFAMYHKATGSVKPEESEFKNSKEIQEAIEKISADLSTEKSRLLKNIEKSKIILPKVTNINEEKKLFKLISQLAEKNNLAIKNINKEVLVTKAVPVKTATDKQQNKKFTESPISLSIQGKFADYLAFKEDMNNEKPILRIDSEVIKIDKISDASANISIDLKITDFVFKIEDFEKVIKKYEKAT